MFNYSEKRTLYWAWRSWVIKTTSTTLMLLGVHSVFSPWVSVIFSTEHCTLALSSLSSDSTCLYAGPSTDVLRSAVDLNSLKMRHIYMETLTPLRHTINLDKVELIYVYHCFRLGITTLEYIFHNTYLGKKTKQNIFKGL